MGDNLKDYISNIYEEKENVAFKPHFIIDQSVHLLNDGKMREWWYVYFKLMMVKCLLTMVKCYSMMLKWVYDHMYDQFITIIDGYSVSDIICTNIMFCIYRKIFHTFIAFMYLPSLEKRSHNWLYWDREIDIVYTVSQSSVRTLFEERPVVQGAEGVSNVCYIKV